MGSGEVGVPDQDVLEQELEELLRCAAAPGRNIRVSLTAAASGRRRPQPR